MVLFSMRRLTKEGAAAADYIIYNHVEELLMTHKMLKYSRETGLNQAKELLRDIVYKSSKVVTGQCILRRHLPKLGIVNDVI